MPTRTTIETYFEALACRSNWQDHLADGMRFASYAAPGKQVTGRDAYVESTKGFYSMIEDLELRQLIIDGDRACALTRYALQPPRGERFTCDVAEFFTVRDDRIDSLEIYFDSARFAR